MRVPRGAPGLAPPSCTVRWARASETAITSTRNGHRSRLDRGHDEVPHVSSLPCHLLARPRLCGPRRLPQAGRRAGRRRVAGPRPRGVLGAGPDGSDRQRRSARRPPAVAGRRARRRDPPDAGRGRELRADPVGPPVLGRPRGGRQQPRAAPVRAGAGRGRRPDLDVVRLRAARHRRGRVLGAQPRRPARQRRRAGPRHRGRR